MLVTARGIVSAGEFLDTWESTDYSFRWHGFIYLLGIPPGVPSIREFARLITVKGIVEAISDLKGHFFIVVKEKQKNSYFCFTDNNGGFSAFHSKSAASSSFLDLISYHGLSKSSLNRESIIEFLNFGNVFANKTLVEDISRIDRNEIIKLGGEGKRKISKNLRSIDVGESDFQFLHYFYLFAKSIRDNRLSVDLTGGVDSRLISVVLDFFGVKFESTISGMDGIDDVEIAKEVAAALGNDLHITYPGIEGLEESIPELFRLSDGVNDTFKHYRSFQHNRNRLSRGMDLAITGIGGEFLKDELWLQDFPFYSSKTSRLDRFVTLRLLPIRCGNEYFSNEYAEENRRFKDEVVAQLTPFAMETNTKTYDNIYYNYDLPTVAGGFISAANRVLPSYAPLMEMDFVHFGYGLKRTERFFNSFHRRTISKVSPAIARIRTSEGGVSASAELWEIGKDLQKYVKDKGSRLAKVMRRRLFGTTHEKQSADHPDLYKKIRNLAYSRQALEILQEEKILHQQVKLNDIQDAHLGHFISLSLFVDFLQAKGQSAIGKREAVFAREEHIR